MTREAPPFPVLIYGLLGLIPFLLPPVLAWAHPPFAELALSIQAHYAAMILSFLGGARWGLAASRPAPGFAVVSLSMIPTLAALALLEMPSPFRGWQLFGLAFALAAQWAWDLLSPYLPPWFARLRTVLTLGAIVGLLGGVLALKVLALG